MPTSCEPITVVSILNDFFSSVLLVENIYICALAMIFKLIMNQLPNY